MRFTEAFSLDAIDYGFPDGDYGRWSRRSGPRPLYDHGSSFESTVAVGDVDGDGTYEFVLSTVASQQAERHDPATTQEDVLVVVDADGTERWRADTGRGPEIAHHPWWHKAVGDVDGDGKDEVVHGLSDAGSFVGPEPGCLHLVDHGGSTRWLREDYHGVEAVCVGDVDGDGHEEIVAAWKEDDESMIPPGGVRPPHYPVGGSTYGRYVVYDADGTPLAECRVGPTAPFDHHEFADEVAPGRFSHHNGIQGSLGTADLDGDGREEILAPSGDNDAFRILAYDGSDELAVRWTAPYVDEHGDDRAWGDVDGDGEQEVFLFRDDHTITGHDADGTERWRVHEPDIDRQIMGLIRNENDGSWRLYTTETHGERVTAFDPIAGDEVWTRPLGDPEANFQIGLGDVDDDGDEEIALTVEGTGILYERDGTRLGTVGETESFGIVYAAERWPKSVDVWTTRGTTTRWYTCDT